jgi:1,4-dihydroxy-2-naphthoate octaprenyltransferase
VNPVIRTWIAGARPQTLTAAAVSVIVGTAAAGPPYRLDLAALAALVAFALQIGANYANDYSDGIRGTDAVRTGPARLVASGAATPAAVLRAAVICFAITALAGIALSFAAGAPWLILVGVSAIAAAWFYTGGKRPYGYYGLGEVSVFIFFGLFGTLGTTFVQHGRLTSESLWASVAVGSLTTALLVANNLRDIPGDAASGKFTLAVKLGDPATRILYLALLAAAAISTLGVVIARPWVALAFIAIAVAVRPVRTVCAGATGKALVPVLVDTGRLELVFALLFALSLSLSS